MAEKSKSTSQIARMPDRNTAGTFTSLAAIALAIIGLAGVFPSVLLSISTIAIGAALVFQAGAVSARYSALMVQPEIATRSYEAPRWGGTTIGFLAGVAGIGLGILALLRISPMVLTPIASILYGTALILDSGVYARLNALEAERASFQGATREVIRENAAVASGIQVLVGLGGVTLGILALLGMSAGALSLIVMMTIGAALILSTFLVSGRIVSVFRG